MNSIREKAIKETEFRYKFCSNCRFGVANRDLIGPYFLSCTLGTDLHDDYFEHDECPGFEQIAYDNTIKKREVKTRQSELLGMYPNADLYYDGVIDLKPCRMDTTMLHRGGKCEQYNDCNKCRHDFWMAQLKHD